MTIVQRKKYVIEIDDTEPRNCPFKSEQTRCDPFCALFRLYPTNKFGVVSGRKLPVHEGICAFLDIAENLNNLVTKE